MMIGMDFGTTNTGAAAYDGRNIRLLPLDPASSTPQICRTSIYMTRGHDYYLGSAALSLYFDQNVGRPTRYRKVKVGEIIQVFAELPTFYRDVFVYEDEFSPGRLFLSIKTALRNPTYYGTVFLDRWYSASDLAAIFLMGMKMRMEAALGTSIRELVLGRPVHFSDDPAEDKVAQSRLLDAAFRAGFEKVYLEYEPVAAALSYERTISDKEIVLVFDFGGGTLDFTVMELGDLRQRKVLATGGIPVAGDIFDQRLFRATIPRHLGENDSFISGGNRYPIPAHIFDLLSTPQEVVSLNTPQNLEMLRSIHQGALHKEKTHALLRMVSSNYTLYMFDLVERAKRQLSDRVESKLDFKAEDIHIEETILRTRFERAIRREYEQVRAGLLDVLERSGLAASDIQRVIRTGGSSQIPLFSRLLNDLFGAEKVRAIDIFSSVTSGLAIRGHEVTGGLAELKGYTPASLHRTEEMRGHPAPPTEAPPSEAPPSEAPPSQGSVTPVDLDSVRKRLEINREYREGQARLPSAVLAVLDKEDGAPPASMRLRLLFSEAVEARLRARQNGESQGSPVANIAAPPDLASARAIHPTPFNEHFLLATNTFKLISVPVQAAFLAQEAGPEGIRELLRLEPDEAVTALVSWNPDAVPARWLCLVSSFGQARSFDARLLAESVAKLPYFQLERRYTGHPAALLFAGEGDRLWVGTDGGRFACVAPEEIGVVVWDGLKVRKEERVSSAAVYPAGTPLLALNPRGVALPLPEIAGAQGLRAQSLRAQSLRPNFTIVGFYPAASASQGFEAAALSNQGRLYSLSSKYNLKSASPSKVCRLSPGESLVSLV